MLAPLRKRNEIHGGLYRYHPGDPFLPGSGIDSLEMGFTLPLVALLGTCVLAGAPPSSESGPQVYIAAANHTSGIGGQIPYNSFITQGLYDGEGG